MTISADIDRKIAANWRIAFAYVVGTVRQGVDDLRVELRARLQANLPDCLGNGPGSLVGSSFNAFGQQPFSPPY